MPPLLSRLAPAPASVERVTRLRPLSALAALAAGVVVLLAACAPAVDPAATVRANPEQIDEVDTSDFDPGLIVSDDSFFDSTALDEEQIQDFLEALPCRPDAGITCLADYRQTTETQPAAGPGHCAEYRGAVKERASRIIAKTAVACGVSPKTLLVLLQKEQSLLTRPSEHGYLRATGYACPDTADCDVKYFGFFNQLYNAAWQFRQYTQQPDRQYRIGAVPVSYNPDAACGASTVLIRNQATANLYNYTPYQPNEAALASADAGGDGCSAWGNLNFWLLWNRWFGDPTSERYPGFLPPCSRLVDGQVCPTPGIPTAPPRED